MENETITIQEIDAKAQIANKNLTWDGLKNASNQIAINLKKPWKSLPTCILHQKAGSTVKGMSSLKEAWAMINKHNPENATKDLETLISNRNLIMPDGSILYATSKK